MRPVRRPLASRLLDAPKVLARRLVSPQRRAWLAGAARRVAYFGVMHACPFCGGRFRSLLPFGHDLPVLQRAGVIGGGRRNHALCPVCWSSDRERLVFLYLQRRTALFSRPHELLHIAPERHLRSALARLPGSRYVSGDLSSADVMVRLDVARSPFSDGSFDAIICNHVLEHVPDDSAAMREILRLLKPGGWALLQVPIGLALAETVEDPSAATPEAREEAFGQRDHVRIYARDYEQRLAAAGFRVEVDGFAAELEGGEAERYGLDRREKLYVCRKAPA